MNNRVILIVEDNPTDVFLIEEVFAKTNLTVYIQSVETGKEAIDYLTGKNSYVDRENYPLPVLILTDIEIPGMSGLELLQWLKQQSQLKQLPVVVMSGIDHEEQARKLGANSYILKTPQFEKLPDIIKALIPET